MKTRVFTVFLIIIAFCAMAEEVKAQTLPVREFVIDTLGKPAALTENDKGTFDEFAPGESKWGLNPIKTWPDSKGTLKDNKSGQVWDIEYEKKGASRDRCHPPVLNIKFDKKDKKDRPKPLFDGVSTFENNTSLKYRKIRIVPECELWGFDINVLLRESFIYRILRIFGLPITDVIGFANITFKSKDLSDTQTYRYMILQRDNESDDQIPFTKQFNLLADLIEADEQSTATDEMLNRVRDMNNYDPDNIIRSAILGGLLNMNDRGGFHNEDYGIDASTGKIKRVLFDFDMSIGGFCSGSDTAYSAPLNVVRSILSSISSKDISIYRKDIAKISREIFDNPQSLSTMLKEVDRFPFSLTDDKKKLKAYLEKNFNIYAEYFGSKRFADEVDIPYKPFNNPVILPPINKSIKVLSPKEGEDVDEYYQAQYESSGVFFLGVELIDSKGKSYPISLWSGQICDGKISIDMQNTFPNDNSLVSDKDDLFILHIYDLDHPEIYGESGKFKIIKRDQGELRGIEPKVAGKPSVDIITPSLDEVIEKGTTYVIRYTANGIFNLKLDLMDYKGIKVIRTIEPSLGGGQFREYYWSVPEDIDLGREDLYIIRISDADNPKVYFKSDKFIISEKNEPKIETVSNTLSLEYDKNKKESALVSKAVIKVTAHKNADLIIPKVGAIWVYAEEEKEKWAFGDTSYTSKAPRKDFKAYLIKKGKSENFELISRFNPKIMFPGSYEAHIGGIRYGENYFGYTNAQSNESNPVVIIGETSPYINGITYSDSPPKIDSIINIIGERFGTGMVDVYINSKEFSLLSKKIGQSYSISFIPEDLGIRAGWIEIQVSNPTEGASNFYPLELLP